MQSTQKTKAGHLINETFSALLHTVDTLVLLVNYLLDNAKWNYVMLGRFQPDNLETRFGQYIMLSGTNYLMSVKEVIQSERGKSEKSTEIL